MNLTWEGLLKLGYRLEGRSGPHKWVELDLWQIALWRTASVPIRLAKGQV